MRESMRAAGITRWMASHGNGPPLTGKASSRSSRLLNTVKHPLNAMKNAKRVRSPEQGPKPVKRLRAGNHDVIELDSDGDVVSARPSGTIRQIGGRAMPSSADEAEVLVQRAGATDTQLSSPSTADVLKVFRLDNRRLGWVLWTC